MSGCRNYVPCNYKLEAEIQREIDHLIRPYDDNDKYFKHIMILFFFLLACQIAAGIYCFWVVA